MWIIYVVVLITYHLVVIEFLWTINFIVIPQNLSYPIQLSSSPWLYYTCMRSSFHHHICINIHDQRDIMDSRRGGYTWGKLGLSGWHFKRKNHNVANSNKKKLVYVTGYPNCGNRLRPLLNRCPRKILVCVTGHILVIGYTCVTQTSKTIFSLCNRLHLRRQQ